MSAKELEFLTNESIEGGSLAVRLMLGPLPEQEALRFAIDIGTALSRAHRCSVIHGKISAHSILLTTTGARIVRPSEDADPDTLPYRSPEQVRGETPDWRSDIFAFGALLYEMVGRQRAFSDEGAALDRAILEQAPAALLSKSPVHGALEGVIASCLAKDAGRRRQRVQNAVIELKLVGRAMIRLAELRSPPRVSRVFAGGPVLHRPKKQPRVSGPVRFPEEIQGRRMAPKRRSPWKWLWFLASVAVVALVAVPWYRTKPTQAITFDLAPANNTTYRMPSVSPDGHYVALQASGPNGTPMLWLRSLNNAKPVAIAGTEGGSLPFWSPDGAYLAFFGGAALKTVRISDRTVQRICNADDSPGGGSWSRAGIILFAPGQDSTLYQVPAAGGEPQPVTQLNAGKFEHAHLWPQFLPDDKHYLFFVLGETGNTGVYIGALGSPDYRLLFESQTNAVYSPGADSESQGYLVYIRNRNLMGVAFSASRLRVEGDAALVQEDVGALRSLSFAAVSASRSGTLVFQSAAPATRQLVWMDRNGKVLARAGETGDWGPPRISPDGTRAVASKISADKTDAQLWMIDREGKVEQFTRDTGQRGSPVWSSDGSRIAYFADPEGHYDLFVSPAKDGTKVEPLLKSDRDKYPTDWSRDGRYLIFAMLSKDTSADIWALSLADRKSGPVLDTIYAENNAALSPEGRWLAYQSNQSGRFKVYVQPFDGIKNGTKREYTDISAATGGGLPRWRADAQELFFMTYSGRMMAVSVNPYGNECEHGKAQPLFQTLPMPGTWNHYDVSPDGERFLVNLPFEWSGASPITVMTKWDESFKSTK